MDHIYPIMGWGPNMHWYPTGDVNEVYQVDLNMSHTGKRGSFRQECMINAIKCAGYADSTDKPIRLLISGGMDSHSMFFSFVLQRVPVRACVYQVYMHGVMLNGDDFNRGLELCRQYKVPVEILCVDATDYAADAVARKYHYSERKDLGLYLRRVAADHFQDEFVCMVGDVHTIGYMPEIAKHDFVAIFKPLNPTPTPFAYKKSGVSCFHQMTRASTMAYLEDPVLWKWKEALPDMYPSFGYIADPKKLGSLKGGVKFYEYLFKPQIFANNWPEMQVHPKATGLEAYDFTQDENAIDITTIQLKRSIVKPVRDLLAEMEINDVNLISSNAPCERLLQFKEQQ